MNKYNVSIAGSGISFMAGACLCTGANLLRLYYDIVLKGKIPDRDYITKVSSLTFLGGGMTSFGLYFLVPNAIRTLWF
jgi:hypothetical protein